MNEWTLRVSGSSGTVWRSLGWPWFWVGSLNRNDYRSPTTNYNNTVQSIIVIVWSCSSLISTQRHLAKYNLACGENRRISFSNMPASWTLLGGKVGQTFCRAPLRTAPASPCRCLQVSSCLITLTNTFARGRIVVKRSQMLHLHDCHVSL